jgi:tetratricopeptide (TPR) repeat protein
MAEAAPKVSKVSQAISLVACVVIVCVTIMDFFGGREGREAEAIAFAGTKLEDKGDYAGALAKYDEVLAYFGKKGNWATLQFPIAFALVRKGTIALEQQHDPKAALEAFNKAIHISGQGNLDNGRYTRNRPFVFTSALLGAATAFAAQNDIPRAIAALDLLIQRFGDARNPLVRSEVAKAWYNKGILQTRTGNFKAAAESFKETRHNVKPGDLIAIRQLAMDAASREASLQLELFGNPQGAWDAVAALLHAYCRPETTKRPLRAECIAPLSNSVEPLLALHKTQEAKAAIATLQKALKPNDGRLAIMAFLGWIAEPEAPTAPVLEAIHAVPADAQTGWTFTAMRRYAAAFPKPRKAQAACFFNYFEQHRDKAKLDACLAAAH